MHRQRAERRLQEGPEEDEEGQAAVAAREDPRHERAEDREEGEDAIAELDVRVEALRLEVVRLTAGPVLAAETGAGEAHGRTGRDDEDEHPGVRERQQAQRAR